MIDYYKSAKEFIETMPYKQSPYSGRNWGHKWHSLCSYHGKLKPAIAYFLIRNFTQPGDVVLDPLCGVGTIPFEASLQGRIGVGNDLSELAYCVTKAKLEKPDFNLVVNVLNKLEAYIADNLKTITFETAPYKNFGYNGKLSDYFDSNTYIELLLARQFFLNRLKDLTAADAVAFSALLHVLHGNRPYALSRTSHPLTPYSPRGEFIYKNVVHHIRKKVDLTYKCTDFASYIPGKSYCGSYESLQNINADIIITSPPFADSIRFYMQNWMRLWLCGWGPEDFKSADTRFIDNAQNNNFDIYYAFFKRCSNLLKPNGRMILHLGKTKRFDMSQELSLRASDYFNIIYQGSESVTEIEKHGIKDKGATIEHQFLFLQKK